MKNDDKLRRLFIEKLGPELGNARADAHFKRIADAKRKEEIRIKNIWDNLDLTCKNAYVPEIEKPITKDTINKLLNAGATHLNELQDLKWYYGQHRNTKMGQWIAKEGCFNYINYTMGFHRVDQAPHFMNDDGGALFIPFRLATEKEITIELEKTIP
jgi:hypothetical protein